MLWLFKPAVIRPRQINKAQASLELAVAVILLLILFVAALRIFFWANRTVVNRQTEYEYDPDFGRVASGEYNRTNTIIKEQDIRRQGKDYVPLNITR